MNSIQTFVNEKFGEIRTVVISREVWFVGKDIAIALGYKNTRQAIATNVMEEDRGVHSVDTPSGKQDMTIINESGLYSLIFGSKLEGAKDFTHWVTSEVLPILRKSGTYSINQTQQMNFSPDPSETMKVGEAVKMGEFLWKLVLASGGNMNHVNRAIKSAWESHGFRFPPVLESLIAPEQTNLFPAMDTKVTA